MEAGRPVIRNPSLLEGVVSLLVTLVMIYPSRLHLRAESVRRALGPAGAGPAQSLWEG